MLFKYGKGKSFIELKGSPLKSIKIKYEGFPFIIKRNAFKGALSVSKGQLIMIPEEPISQSGVLFEYMGYFRVKKVFANDRLILHKTMGVNVFNYMVEKWDDIDIAWSDLKTGFLKGRRVKDRYGR